MDEPEKEPRLRTIREQAGLSQRALDEAAGVPRGTTHRLETTGWRALQVASRIARALGRSIDDIAGRLL